MTQTFLQNNNPDYDPRQELVPRAPDVDGDLPSGSAPDLPTGDIGGSINTPNFGGGLSEMWSNLFGGDFWSWLPLLGGIGAALAWLWSVYTFLAYLISLFFILLYIYATIRLEYYSGLITKELRDEEARWNDLHGGGVKNSRLDDVLKHVGSESPNDWKLAIIEADVILDQALIEQGYVGGTLGERLRNITPNQLGSINDAWEAHLVRNKIAHEGADFVLTKRMAEETITRYRHVFTELGVK